MPLRPPLRPRFGIRNVSFAIAVVAGLDVWLAGCDVTASRDVERRREASPDKLLDAVIEEHGTWATNPTAYRVYVVYAGARARKSDLVLDVERASALTVKWLSKDLLVVSCNGGEVNYFRNYASVTSPDKEITVENGVRLECGQDGYLSGTRVWDSTRP